MTESAAQCFEAIMLICFGISWPLDILNTLRIKQSTGKSQAFMALILVGYTAGIVAKVIISRANGAPLQAVTWLYALNMLFVIVDIVVSRYYARPHRHKRAQKA